MHPDENVFKIQNLHASSFVNKMTIVMSKLKAHISFCYINVSKETFWQLVLSFCEIAAGSVHFLISEHYIV